MEPYRMFTSRAEYRLLLREDNADLRLTERGRELGLVDDQRWQRFTQKQEGIVAEEQRLSSTWIQPGSREARALEPNLEHPLSREYNLAELLKRPQLGYSDLSAITGEATIDAQVAEQVEIKAKYAGYIERQQVEIDRLRRHEKTALPADFDYSSIEGLSNEVKQKLSAAKPETLARASRIPGVTPAAVSLLLIYLKKRGALDRRIA
jgi:tRNA uridine 5-carboxymethylaminomethyl modification enzyme